MGINLTLVIDQHGHDPILAYTRLPLYWQDYAAFDELTELSTHLETYVGWYDDSGLVTRTVDPYGDPLTFITAHELATFLEEQGLQGWDLAVLSFVQMLPAATKVALWWS